MAWIAYVLNSSNRAAWQTTSLEQAAKLELVINLKTAKAPELTIPQSVPLRADVAHRLKRGAYDRARRAI